MRSIVFNLRRLEDLHWIDFNRINETYSRKGNWPVFLLLQVNFLKKKESYFVRPSFRATVSFSRAPTRIGFCHVNQIDLMNGDGPF